MVAGIFNAILEIAQAFITLIIGVFSGLQALIWTAGTGSDPGTLTFFGTLILLSAGTGVVYWAVDLVRSLVRINRN